MKISRSITVFHRNLLFALVFLSGASSLIYEVVWQRYLVILLGAQAKATAIVIAIFLGGLGLGYSYFGRVTRKTRFSLFAVYAAIELALAAWAFLFPFLFRTTLRLTPGLYGLLGVNSFLIDVGISILLLGLPTFLMGGTLPILTQAACDRLDELGFGEGRIHSRLYGLNTLGGGIGCLFCGYILIPLSSFSTALFCAGLLNIAVGISVVCFFVRNPFRKIPSEPPHPGLEKMRVGFLLVAFLSGFIMTGVESVLLRLMGLATGSSNYSFSLLLSVFILSLGLWAAIAQKFQQITIFRLALNQLALSFLLLLLYLSGDYWSYTVHLIRVMLRDLPQGFYLFQFLLGASLFGVLLFPIGCAGMTLPLCFQLCKKEKGSLGYQTGRLYGLNTLGALLGGLVGGYLLFYFFNLDQLFKIFIFLSTLSAGFCLLLTRSQMRLAKGKEILSWTLVGALFCANLFTPPYHKNRFLQPFRQNVPMEATFEGADRFGNFLSRSTRLLAWRDGPNGSVAIGATPAEGQENSRTLYVNGKSDGNTAGDFFTMMMLGHLGALFAENLEQVCVIGLGTGMTASVISQYPETTRVDVVEISESVIKQAPLFDAYNGRFSSNPKAHFHQMDAFKFLNAKRTYFDLIVSEPSNPWVTGVENLYTREFYHLAKSRLSEGGLFVQWIHSYSFNDALMRMVLKTLGEEFASISVFQLKGGDLALVAGARQLAATDISRALSRMRLPQVNAALGSVGIQRIETVLALEIASPRMVIEMAEGAALHLLESPRLSDDAARAFFANQMARVHLERRHSKGYLRSLRSSLLAQYLGDELLSRSALRELSTALCSGIGIPNSNLCDEVGLMALITGTELLEEVADTKPEDALARRELSALTRLPLNKHKVFTIEDLNGLSEAFEIYRKYASPIVYLSPRYFFSGLDECLKGVPRTADLYGECMLNKLLVLDALRVNDEVFLELGQNYMKWFRQISESGNKYKRFREARDVLARLMVEYQ